MQKLRTPDDCFDNLVGYPFKPNYIEVDDFEGDKLLPTGGHSPAEAFAKWKVFSQEVQGQKFAEVVPDFIRENPLS